MESKENLKTENLRELEKFIESNPDPRELKRALAIQMLIQGLTPAQIQKILGVSPSFISKWKVNYALEGLEALKLKYQGSEGYLSKRDRAEVIEWLKNKNHVHLNELETYLEINYGLRFRSKRSYYLLLKEGKISWKKTQKKNPNRNEELVESKQEEICHILETNREQIEEQKLIVYLIDECHLLWGDICGYGWGATEKRLEIPMTNERERTTYYGALNYQTKQLILQEYDAGNAKNTVFFLEKLRQLNPESRLLIIWDGASYHRYKEMKTYLQEVNQGLEESKREINCVLFAPNAPEQNPVEDIWLQGKNYLRKFWYKLTSFQLVKWFFTFVLANEIFDFPKINKYGFFSNQADTMSVVA